MSVTETVFCGSRPIGPREDERKEPMTNRVGQIAMFVNERTVGINRGAREGVRPSSLYCILENDQEGDIIGLLQVFEVRELVSLAKPLWVSERCLELKIGWHIYLMEIAEA